MKFISLLITAITLYSSALFAQDDLLNELEAETKHQAFEQPAFKAMKIGNLQSTKLAGKGDLYMYVSHRFGALENWKRSFFGFDYANTKLQLFYGVTTNLQVGLGRESIRKAYSGHIKYSVLKQNKNTPVNVVGYTLTTLRTDLLKETYPRIKFADRMSYVGQLLISRRFSNSFSFELAPTYIRHNLISNELAEKHNQIALAAGGRLKFSKRMSFNFEYSYNFSRFKKPDYIKLENSPYIDPFTVGVDIETGGHIFQLLFTNTQSTNETGFMSYADGYTYFGFNIIRVF